MFSRNQTEPRQRRREQSLRLQRVASLFYVLVFLISQVIPATAGTLGTWVEVCGASGVYLARLDQGEEVPELQCKRCPLCLARSFKMPWAPTGEHSIVHSPDFNSVAYVYVLTKSSSSSEWGLHACRGPPPIGIGNPVPSNFHFDVQIFVESASLKPWGESWV